MVQIVRNGIQARLGDVRIELIVGIFVAVVGIPASFFIRFF